MAAVSLSADRIGTVAPATLKGWLHDGDEIALLDASEAGQFGEAHLFFAIPMPYSRLEIEAPRLLPRRGVRVVVYDDGNTDVAVRAARRLLDLGYDRVHILAGGAAGWSAAGFELFKGVNVPSKCFGELVEHAYHTPRITAQALAAMAERGEDFVVIDGRPFAEFQKMSIPGAICCPNGELVYRFRELVPRPDTKVVINCAGRTRSIIGAQTLINFGVTNPVLALENGTQGWMLAGFKLDRGSEKRYPEVLASDGFEAERMAAIRLAERFGVPTIDQATMSAWMKDPKRTTYLCDVRTATEFKAGSLAGAVHAPGGQLMQATDQWIGVRNARIVVFDAESIRAPTCATWLKQMGHEVAVLRVAGHAGFVPPGVTQSSRAPLRTIEAVVAHDLCTAGKGRIVDLRASMSYRKLHAAGAQWSIRSRVVSDVGDARTSIVLIADEPEVAELAAIDLWEAGITDVRLLAGGYSAWQSAGLPVESSAQHPVDAECIDYLFFVHDRHEGNEDAARAYLAWETQLLSQIDARECATFRIPT